MSPRATVRFISRADIGPRASTGGKTMHVRELVETSCWIADNAPAFVAFSGPIAMELIEGYWAASRCRLDRWSHSLKSLSAPKAAAGLLSLTRKKPARLPLIEEILVSEVLTRVWTAVAAAHDEHRRRSELAPSPGSARSARCPVRRRGPSVRASPSARRRRRPSRRRCGSTPGPRGAARPRPTHRAPPRRPPRPEPRSPLVCTPYDGIGPNRAAVRRATSASRSAEGHPSAWGQETTPSAASWAISASP